MNSKAQVTKIAFLAAALFTASIIPTISVNANSAEYHKFDERENEEHHNLEMENEYRTFDGTGNNIANPLYGSANIPLLRKSGIGYSDGISAPAGQSRLSAREISNIVAAQNAPIPSAIKVSDMIWAYGQFLDHDLDLTPAGTEAFNIPVPTGDPFFDPLSEGNKVIPFKRSINNGGSPREQLNVITAFIDASVVYGSDQSRADALRTFSGGKLKTSSGNMLPFNTDGLPNAVCTTSDCWLAGDVRANEQTALTALHTLFVREHNRLADQIANQDPDLSDEEIYQMARKIVGAEMQVITYKEFLPLILGKNAIPPYRGYNPNIDPSIITEFSTGAFRFHSQIGEDILRIKNNGGVVEVPLSETSFKPSTLLLDGGLDSIMRGLAAQRAEENDLKIVNGIRNTLFGSPGSGGIDLFAVDIQRGRDHGLPDYNTVRIAYGLAPVTRFEDISSDPAVVNALKAAYSSVDDIDLLVGGLAEDHVPGALVGKTFRAILIDQFIKLRDGDRFWYQNDPFFDEHKDLKKWVDKVRLSTIIRLNTNADDVQENVFICKENKLALKTTHRNFCNV